jgi:hypothetical protein
MRIFISDDSPFLGVQDSSETDCNPYESHEFNILFGRCIIKGRQQIGNKSV